MSSTGSGSHGARTAPPCRALIVAFVSLLVAGLAATAPASAQEPFRRASPALAILDNLDFGPFTVRAIAASPDGYLNLSFLDPATLARPELDIVAVLTPLPGADAARTVTEKRGDQVTARHQRARDEGWEDVRIADARVLGPATLEVPTPQFAASGRDDAVFVTVNVPTQPEQGTWRSPPFLLRDLIPATPGEAGVAPWAWVDSASGGPSQRVSDPSAPSLEGQAGAVRLVEPPAPSEVGGRPVQEVVDRVLVRPAGLGDIIAPFEIRVDPVTMEAAAFAQGSDQPLPAPPGAPVAAGGGRWGTGPYWRATPVAGARALVFDKATLESVIGQPLTDGALIGIDRTVRLQDGSSLAYEGTDATFPRGEQAATAAGSDGADALRQLGIGAPAPSPAPAQDDDRVVATIVLVVGGSLLLAAVAFSVGRSVAGTAWWRHRRRLRRQS